MSQPVVDQIRAERLRQIQSEGYKPEDDMGRVYELANAAAVYAHEGGLTVPQELLEDSALRDFWPWATKYYRPSLQRRTLIKAGALIVAAIEALDATNKKQELRTYE